MAGATFTLIYKRLRSSGPGSLPAQAAMLTYIALCPFLDAAEACRRRLTSTLERVLLTSHLHF